ncbi:MAG: RdgB/HAM1 family non-canonical purine NTP pyrophosphatase [Bacilli bacterium]
MDLLFASSNKNKVEEVKLIFNKHNIISLADLNDYDEVDENGSSFHENAYLKAKYFYDKYKIAVFADDSGLVVEALNGNPGIRSARYSGENATYLSNNLKLLAELKDKTNRHAYFISVICFIDESGEVHYFEGRVDGEISQSIQSDNGFGYDPIFYLPEYNKTFAELGSEKNKISHRAKALFSLNKFLKREV